MRHAIESSADRAFLADAGRLVDRHAMLWIRRLCTPIEVVWDTVSTIEGLKKWWIVPPAKFELRQGGAFHHHWSNTITDYKHHEYIDFAENTGDYASTGGMRFELRKVDDDTTLFMFLDTWGPGMGPQDSKPASEQPGGPGTPWPGVAAGWHAMVDRLEHAVTGQKPEHSDEELTGLYRGYLRDLYRWRAMVQRGKESERSGTITSPVTPAVRYRDAPAGIRWLVDVLGFRIQDRHDDPNGSVAHARLTWHTGQVFVSTRGDGSGSSSGPGPASIALNTADPSEVDARYETARAAGAAIVGELEDAPFGSHQFSLRDPEGNFWTVGTYLPQIDVDGRGSGRRDS